MGNKNRKIMYDDHDTGTDNLIGQSHRPLRNPSFIR